MVTISARDARGYAHMCVCPYLDVQGSRAQDPHGHFCDSMWESLSFRGLAPSKFFQQGPSQLIGWDSVLSGTSPSKPRTLQTLVLLHIRSIRTCRYYGGDCRGGIRTRGLRVMSPTSYHCYYPALTFDTYLPVRVKEYIPNGSLLLPFF